VHDQIIEMALEQSELSPRELAVRITDEKHYFVSEATAYRLLKAHDLITSPADAAINAANEFQHKTNRASPGSRGVRRLNDRKTAPKTGIRTKISRSRPKNRSRFIPARPDQPMGG